MPDKATATAPWWATNGPEPTSKPAKVDLEKTKTNSGPAAVVQHQLKAENGVF